MSDSSIQYPTWHDVGIPPLVVEWLRKVNIGSVMDYLIMNRIFRFYIKAQYNYECNKCGYTKSMSRQFEDYSRCEKCGSNKICSTAYWRMGKDKIEFYSIERDRDGFVAKIIQQMTVLHEQYFHIAPPDDFVTCGWKWNKQNIPAKAPTAFGAHTSDADIEPDKMLYAGRSASFVLKFICGEEASSHKQDLSVCRAAILSPFLWDDRFDWKYLTRRDRGRETHIIPLLNVLSKLNGSNRSFQSKSYTKDEIRLQNEYYSFNPQIGTGIQQVNPNIPDIPDMPEQNLPSDGDDGVGMLLEELLRTMTVRKLIKMTNLLHEYRNRHGIPCISPINEGSLFFDRNGEPSLITITSSFTKQMLVCPGCIKNMDAICLEIFGRGKYPSCLRRITHTHMPPEADLLDYVRNHVPQGEEFTAYVSGGERDQERWLWEFFKSTSAMDQWDQWTKFQGSHKPAFPELAWLEEALYVAMHCPDMFRQFYDQIYSICAVQRKYILSDDRGG